MPVWKSSPLTGATGYTDTNYRGKAEKALAALKELDLVFVHVEAPDEMGHEGNVEGKVQSIEDFDEKVVGTVLRGMEGMKPFRIAVLSDHPTPISTKTHVGDPSPFAVLSSLGVENSGQGDFLRRERSQKTGNIISPGHLLMETFIGNWRSFVEKTPVKIRVIYADTDAMGIVYHTNYIRWFEIGRNELFRDMHILYTEIETAGYNLPLTQVHCHYLLPTHYDDVVLVDTDIEYLKWVSIKFTYQIWDEPGKIFSQRVIPFMPVPTSPARSSAYRR